MAAESRSKFTQLPGELLLKILEELDNEAILSCTQLSSFLRTAGIDILLLRHNILDPSLYCEVQATVPGRLSQAPLPDALSALLINARRYTCIKHLHCTIRPPREYDARFNSRPFHEVSRMECDESASDTQVLADRMSYAFSRIGEFLSRAKALEQVTLKVLDWTQFPDCFSSLFQDLIRTILSKGCSSLQVQCPDAPFGDQGWTLPVPVHPSRPTRLSLSGVLAALRELLSSSTMSQPQSGHLRLPSNPSTGIIPQVTKLDVDSALFHPSGLKWMSDFLARLPLTEFTVSMSPSTASYFTSHGLAALLKGAPRLQSLTVLNATSEDAQQIAPRLRPFLVLKNLAICLASSNSSSNSPSSFEDSATPFAPANLERISLSAELVDYMLLGTVTALNLKELEIVYGKGDKYIPRDIIEDIASVRDFFDKISVPISIAVRLTCTGPYIDIDASHGGDYSETVSPLLRKSPTNPISPSFLSTPEGLKAQNRGVLFHVNTLFLELYPRLLRSLEPEDLNRIVDLVACFSGVRKVVLGCVKDFRVGPNTEATALKEEVVTSIVQPIYARCSGLASLWVGEDEFPRPLVEL